MPDPAPSLWAEMQALAQAIAHAAVLAFVGAAINIGALLGGKDALTRRVVMGRFLTGGGLGMAAGAALSWAPDLPFVAQLGIAAALAILGTAGLERIFTRIVGGREP